MFSPFFEFDMFIQEIKKLIYRLNGDEFFYDEPKCIGGKRTSLFKIEFLEAVLPFLLLFLPVPIEEIVVHLKDRFAHVR